MLPTLKHKKVSENSVDGYNIAAACSPAIKQQGKKERERELDL